MISKLRFSLLLLVVLSLVLAACGGGGGAKAPAGGGGEKPSTGGGGPVTGDASRGKDLFNKTVIGPKSAPGCVTCHSLEPNKTLVGPSLAGVAGRAGSRVSGKSAEEYLRESIVNPNAFVVEGFPSGVMYQNYGKELSEQEIADLVAFLLTLK